jgi:hypothetical protein
MTDQQLIRHLRALDGNVAPATDFADRLFERLLSERTPRRERNPWLLLAATLLLAGGALGAVVVGQELIDHRRTQDQAPIELDVPPTIVAQDVSPALPARLEWTAWAYAGEGETIGVTASTDELWAVTRPVAGELATRRLFRSHDGLDWAQIPLPDEFEPLRYTGIYTAANGQPVLLQSSPLAVFRSAEDGTWSGGLGPQVVQPLIRSGGAGMALIDPGIPDFAAWQSVDGQEWIVIDRPPEVADFHAASVAVGDSGVVIIACRPEGDFEYVHGDDCRSLSSSNGTDWQVSEPLGTRAHVAWFGGRWLSASLRANRSAIDIKSSPDGVAWTLQTAITDDIAPYFTDGTGPSGSHFVERLIVAGDYLIVTTGDTYSRSLLSVDGLDWQELNLDETKVRDAAELDGVLVVAGTGFDGKAQVWTLASEAERP